MPICTRDGFETTSKNSNETFNDSELVFYCETTKEIFRDYEDYFRHVMLINSTIWQCEETGKENLTYAEALYSEKKARKKIETFKEILRAPTLIAIARACQSSFKEINNIAYNLLRDRFFRGEIISASISSSANTYHECKVVDVIKPPNAEETDVIDPNKVMYKLQKLSGQQQDAIFVVPPQNIRRSRNDFSQGNLQLFIKDSVHRVQGIIKPKPEHFKKYISDKNMNWSKLYVGALPAWVPAKPKKEPLAKKEKENKNKEDEKNQNNKDKKQATMSKYVVKSDDIDPAEKIKQEQSLKEQMERLRKEKEEKAAELERKKNELIAKVEADCNRIMTKGDDLERTDQKLMPKYHPVRTVIPTKYFGDLLYCKEFLHSYVGVLSLTEAFKPHISFFEMTRAFSIREAAGPLSDILICLLGSIFSLQGEEEEEQSVEYQKPKGNLENEPYASVKNATETHLYVKKAYQQKLNDLPLDAQTLSEVLRLHLLASGAGVDEKAERWRYMYRNGYCMTEDPGLELRMCQPHIIRALRNYTVYQLPRTDIIKIINTLISQILTYSSTLNTIDERMENNSKARTKIRILIANENKRLNTVAIEKKKLHHQFQLECFEQKDNVEFQTTIRQQKYDELQKQLETIDAKAQKEKNKFDTELSNEYSSIFNFMVYLGSDRAYRKYYVLESIAGVFVEHPLECNDHCLEDPPVNWHVLTNAPKSKKELRNFLTQYYNKLEKGQNKAGTGKTLKKEDLEADKENLQNGKINGLTNGDIKMNGVPELPTQTTETDPLTNGDVKMENGEEKIPSQYELYMCTGNPKHCIVHDSKNPDRVRWSYFYTEEEFDAVANCLNPLAERESQLKEQLMTYKPLLVKHIKSCPIEYLDLEEDTMRLTNFKKNMMSETNKKYNNSNYGMPLESDLNEVMYNALLEKIMQFEIDTTTGCLGKPKVKDLEKWRKDLAENKYDAQGELTWGSDDSLCKKMDDPGDSLGDTLEIESEDSSDESVCNYESPELINYARNLASALLQIAQGIEQKFFKAPFGLQKEIRDKDERKIQLDKAHLKMKQWERSLMNAASYSSVFLHLNVLHDAIKWNRSTNRSNCIVCRRRGDAEKLLLCDECNAGTHMFCMKPKLKKIPEGNWYCKRCVETFGYENNTGTEDTKRKGRKRKEFLPQANDDDEDEVKSNSSKRGRESDDDDFVPDYVKTERKKQKKIDDLFKKTKKVESSEDEEEEDNEDEDADESEEENNSESENEETEEVNGDADEDESEKAADDDEADESDEEEDTQNDESEDEDDDACAVCSYDGIEIKCGVCSKQFHLDCVGLKRNPRGQYKCSKCKEKEEKKKKVEEKRILESNSEESSSDDDEPLVKRPKRGSSDRRSLNKNSKETKTVKEDDSKQSRRGRRTGDDLPLNSVVLYDLLDDISKNKNSWPFLRPVSQSEVPDYYEIIKRPMDFAKIKSKLNMGQYRINEEVLNDIQLVFKNCDEYNTEGNEIYEAGAALERFIINRCKELHLPFRPSDMNTS